MQLTAFAASPDGHRLIDGLAVLRSQAGDVRTLVAEGRVSVGIRIAGAASVWRNDEWLCLPKYTLTGVHCTSRTVRTEPHSALVLVHLNPVAGPTLGFDARQVADRTAALVGAWSAQELESIAHRLAHAEDDASRAALLAAYVTAKLDAGPPPDPLIVSAVRLIRADPAEARVTDVAQALGISVDTLERRFVGLVGVSPKRFARAARLRSAVQAYSAGVTLTDVAMSAGYYDQSHFVREVQRATGVSPSRLLRGQTYC